ncbi:substrate-binding domain-containing protein, partial [Candidatus Accumulibacter sp. ACC012]|uniref:substrate-binding domain-containing protein n=1 Tax=Candidatus Accumulibacter sp. ACC012 TaxID=2823332 RepID=UPI0025BDD74E
GPSRFSGGGSGTGIAAMINGTVDIANSSRKMKDKEIAEAKAKGHDPVEHVVGYDALAILVHKKLSAQYLEHPGTGQDSTDVTVGRPSGAIWGSPFQAARTRSSSSAGQNYSGTYALLPGGRSR